MGVVALWWLAYCFIWSARNQCIPWKPACNDAPINWFSDVIMFGWLDTTLTAGLLAVAAAAMIFLNSSIERNAKKADEAGREKQRFHQELAAISTAFRQASILNSTSLEKNHAEVLLAVAGIEARIQNLSQLAPILSAQLLLILARVRVALNVHASGTQDVGDNEDALHTADALLETGFHYLLRSTRFQFEPTRHERQTLPFDFKPGVFRWGTISQSTRDRITEFIHFSE